MSIRDALYTARMTGHFEALIEEVNRQIDIYASPIAAKRPDAAWGVLPLGFDPETTLELISDFDPEEPDPNSPYSLRLGALKHRLAELELNRNLFLISEQKKDDAHVN